MKAYVTQHKIRFGDVDAAGIAYFPRIFELVHEVFEELWEIHLGVRYSDLILGRRLGFPLVHSEVDFRAPLRFGDRPSVRVTCFRLGRSSLGLRYLFSKADSVCVDARMVTACVHLDTLEPLPMPDEFRSKFEAIRQPEEGSQA